MSYMFISIFIVILCSYDLLLLFILVPPSKFYAQLNPVQINFDALTVLWLNTFALNVYKSLMTTNVANQDNLGGMIYFDILIEAIMPRVSILLCNVHKL